MTSDDKNGRSLERAALSLMGSQRLDRRGSIRSELEEFVLERDPETQEERGPFVVAYLLTMAGYVMREQAMPRSLTIQEVAETTRELHRILGWTVPSAPLPLIRDHCAKRGLPFDGDPSTLAEAILSAFPVQLLAPDETVAVAARRFVGRYSHIVIAAYLLTIASWPVQNRDFPNVLTVSEVEATTRELCRLTERPIPQNLRQTIRDVCGRAKLNIREDERSTDRFPIVQDGGQEE